MTRVLVPGDAAPEFQSQAVQGGEVVNLSLEDALKDVDYLLLVFYPADFTFVCPTEILQFTEKHAEFQEQRCNIVCCSTDSVFTHLAWLKAPKSERGLGAANPGSFVLLSDRSHEISCAYGVLAADGAAYRGTFLIDKNKRICQVTINDMPVGRSVDDALRMLKQLRGDRLAVASASDRQVNSSNAIKPWHSHAADGHQNRHEKMLLRQQQQQWQHQLPHYHQQEQPHQKTVSHTAGNSMDNAWPTGLRLKDSKNRLALVLAEVKRLDREAELQRMDTDRLKAEAMIKQSK